MGRTSSILAFVLIALSAAPASARVSQDYTYSYDQLWRASMRMIAVDFRFPVTQADQEIGFMLFEYQDAGRSFAGSLELVRTQSSAGAPSVRVNVVVQNMPSYVERMMVDRLSRKLSGDYGQPPPNRRAPAEPPRQQPPAEPPAAPAPEGDAPPTGG